MDEARKKVIELSHKYNLFIEPDRIISDISVGMQQRVEILKMLYRENDILIFGFINCFFFNMLKLNVI